MKIGIDFVIHLHTCIILFISLYLTTYCVALYIVSVFEK